MILSLPSIRVVLVYLLKDEYNMQDMECNELSFVGNISCSSFNIAILVSLLFCSIQLF